MAAKRKKKRSSGKGLLVLLLIALIAVVVVCVLANKDNDQNETLGDNIYISDVDVSNLKLDDALSRLKDTEEELASQYSLTLYCGDYSAVYDAQDLGIEFNTEKLLRGAQSGDRLEISVSFRDDTIRTIAEETVSAVEQEKIEPAVEQFDFETLSFTFSEGQSGLVLSADAIKSDILAFLDNTKSGQLQVIPTEDSPAHSVQELEENFGLIASYSTYSTNNENAETNMRIAMEYMHKTVIGAGETFSFNDTTGDSTTPEGGWVLAGAWVQGELQDQYGGGLCQAATTFYHTALLADMEVVERYEHMQPSAYCTEGLDATIDYPTLDLKMKNTSDHPIYVVSEMIDRTLTISLYGYISPDFDYIELEGWTTETVPMPAAEFEEDSTMEEGAYKLIRNGYEGSHAKAQRTWIGFDGSVIKTEELPSSSYSAVAPLYKVGPSTDTGSIPQGSEEGYAPFASLENDNNQGGVTNHSPGNQIRG